MKASTTPTYKFHVEIKKTETDLKSYKGKNFWTYQYWATIVSTNGQIVFVGETRKSKSGLIKTVKNLFGEGIKIVDKTK